MEDVEFAELGDDIYYTQADNADGHIRDIYAWGGGGGGGGGD